MLRTQAQGNAGRRRRRPCRYDAPALDLDELLHQYSVQLRDSDFVSANGQSASLDQPLTDGATYTVMRVGDGDRAAHGAIPRRRPRPSRTRPRPVGDNRTVAGRAGTLTITEVVTRRTASSSGRTIVSKVPLVAAVPTIHYYGTKADPMWDRIAACETGGNWGFVGPSFSGGLGFFNGTWDAFGGRKFAPNAGPRDEGAADHRRHGDPEEGRNQRLGLRAQARLREVDAAPLPSRSARER